MAQAIVTTKKATPKQKAVLENAPSKPLYVTVRKASLFPHSPELKFSQLTPQDVTRDFLDLDDATTFLEMQQSQYVRRLVTTFKLEGVKVVFKGREKWFITIESLQQYKDTSRRRRDRRRFYLWIAEEQEEAVHTALRGADIEYKMEVVYKAPTKKAKPDKPAHAEQDGFYVG